MDDAPTLPDYAGACISNLIPALLGSGERPGWLPEPARAARQVVLLVLDGLGWQQLQERVALAPVLASLVGGPATSVAPTTTATALTSISTGLPPARHGVVGYRVKVTPDGGDAVLNVLRWRTPAGDARAAVPPAAFCGVVPFAGTAPPVVTRAEFADTGFTQAHLAGVRLVGYRVPSTMVGEVRSRADMVDEGWFGGPRAAAAAARLGDVALVARQPVAFVDPADTGEVRLVCRHGSLTPAELLVPLVAGPAASG